MEAQEDATALKFALQDEIKAQEAEVPTEDKSQNIMSRLKKLGVV